MQRHFRFAHAPLVGRVESASIVKKPIFAEIVRMQKFFVMVANFENLDGLYTQVSPRYAPEISRDHIFPAFASPQSWMRKPIS